MLATQSLTMLINMKYNKLLRSFEKMYANTIYLALKKFRERWGHKEIGIGYTPDFILFTVIQYFSLP